jgi:putative DNA primase/helicase
MTEDQTMPEQTISIAGSEDAFAIAFVETHSDRFRYVDEWGQWMEYDGTRWGKDKTTHVFDLARLICREIAVAANDAGAKKIASARTRAAVVSLAQSDRKIVATSDQWDADPWLLNTPDGVVDLKNGKMREHRASDYMIKMSRVAPNAKCQTPLWQKFLDRSVPDRELQRYLQRAVGYALTGLTIEEVLFFLWGDGRNGKGVFVNTIAWIMGDYHEQSSMDTFVVSTTERHPTDLAKLRGARLVTATETEEGKRWDEAKIKMLTGSDPITARFMRADFFTYQPQFTLLISGNNKPGLRSVDAAIRARLKLIPFTVYIPPEERDLHLKEKLKAEAPGILAWAIRGCIDWQRSGMHEPKIVIDATNQYLAAEDTFKLWLDDECVVGEGQWESAGQLYASWQEWAAAHGEKYIINSKRFNQKLEAGGFEQDRRGKGRTRGYTGLALGFSANTRQLRTHGLEGDDDATTPPRRGRGKTQ